MTSPSQTPPGAGSQDAPITNFSQCHVGILSHLSAFGQLPALLAPAAQARQIAADTLRFFRDAVYEHHAEEENELFPAVLGSAQPGVERDEVRAIVDRLTREHRQIESRWAKLEPELKKIAKGQDSSIDAAAITSLVESYQAHARFEEQSFLPMSQTILARNGNHMAALGLSLHLRHKMPEVMGRFGHRI